MLYTLYRWLLVGFFANTLILYFFSMASTVPLVREYAFVGLRIKIETQHHSLTSSSILCRYGDTNDVFPIGGLVAIGETPIAVG